MAAFPLEYFQEKRASNTMPTLVSFLVRLTYERIECIEDQDTDIRQ